MNFGWLRVRIRRGAKHMLIRQCRNNPFHEERTRAHLRTEFIEIRSHRCSACGTCINECPKGVIGKVRFFRHTHAHIDRPDSCLGCRKCVKACPNGAIIEYSGSKLQGDYANLSSLYSGKRRPDSRDNPRRPVQMTDCSAASRLMCSNTSGHWLTR